MPDYLKRSHRKILWFRLHITNLCNFDCPGCHVFKLSENNIQRTNMSLETAKKSIEFFVNLIKRHLPPEEHTTYLSIYGGEPLLNRPVLYEIIRYFGKNYRGVNLNWIINTNGSLLKEEDLKIFFEVQADLHISLDGEEESHNKKRIDKQKEKTFLRVINSIDLCKNTSYPFLQIDSVLNPDNVKASREVIKIAKNKGISRIHLDMFYSPHYKNNFSFKKYAKDYADCYIFGKNNQINIFASPFFQVYSNFINNNQIEFSCSKFPAIEIFSNDNFIFGELPLLRPFGELNQIEDKLIWDLRGKLLLENKEEVEKKCQNCFLKNYCQGEMRRIYRYHTIKKVEEEKICQIARETARLLKQNNFIPLKYVKR